MGNEGDGLRPTSCVSSQSHAQYNTSLVKAITMITEIQLGKKNKYYCSDCKKEFKRRDCAEKHERTCDNAPTSNATKHILQTGGGIVGKFDLTKSSRTSTG